DLPPAPLVQMRQGIAPDTGEMELWIATTGEGVLAFDGKRFRQIRPDRAEQRTVTSVLPLSTGRLLLGTAKAGVLSWDGKNLTPFHASLTNLNITALAGDESNIWVGTIDRGALHWRAGQVDSS